MLCDTKQKGEIGVGVAGVGFARQIKIQPGCRDSQCEVEQGGRGRKAKVSEKMGGSNMD